MKRNTLKTPIDKALDVVSRYKNGESVLSIEKSLSISESTIYRILWSNNIERTPKNMINRKHQVNEGYFNSIDTEAKAYFLGLLFADGTNDGKKKLTIRLQEEDSYILDVLKNEICPSTKMIRLEPKCEKCKPQYSLDIYSGNLCRNLSSIGCIPRKSKGMDFPNIPNEYLNHFVRGYFDGDGSVCIRNKTEKHYRFFSVSFTSCYTFLLDLKASLESEGFKIGKIKMDGRNDYTASFNINGYENIKKFYKWLYNDSNIYLTRKESKLKQIESWCTN